MAEDTMSACLTVTWTNLYSNNRRDKCRELKKSDNAYINSYEKSNRGDEEFPEGSQEYRR